MLALNGSTPGACPTCGFPPSEQGYLRSNFPPGHPKFGALVSCPDCHEATLSERLSNSSQLTGWLKSTTLDGYRGNNGNTDALRASVSFAKNPVGWLTLWGTYGPGKTHLLAAVVNQCTRNRMAGVYYTLPDLLDKLRDSYSDDGFSTLFDRLVKVPLLALDEVDKVRLTDWAQEKMYQLFDARYRDLDTRGTLFALNVEPEPTDEAIGYLYSRMHDRRNKVIEVAGGDVRPVAA
jgi:DNA replication protein DnaC